MGFSYIIYFIIMYTRHIILILNPIWIYLFVFKLTFNLSKFFFGLFKIHFVNLVQIVLIVIRVQELWCFSRSTYFLCLI